MSEQGLQHWEYWKGDLSDHPEIKKVTEMGLISSGLVTLAIPVGRYGEPNNFSAYKSWRMNVREEIEARTERAKEYLSKRGHKDAPDIAYAIHIWANNRDDEDLGPVEFVEHGQFLSRLVDMDELLLSPLLASFKYNALRHESIDFSDVEANTRRTADD